MKPSASLFIVSVSLILASCGTAPAPDTSHPAATVTMTKGAFDPDPVTVQQGQTVCWINRDSVDHWPASNIHPTHEIYPEFDPKRGIKPGETWCFAFGRAGIWKYHDHLFPEIVGTVNDE